MKVVRLSLLVLITTVVLAGVSRKQMADGKSGFERLGLAEPLGSVGALPNPNVFSDLYRIKYSRDEER
jgi:hypothetical protein